MEIKVGLQLFTVRNYLRKNFKDGLKTFGDMGYQSVEFASFDPEAMAGDAPLPKMGALELKELLHTYGMHAVTSSVPVANCVTDLLNEKFDWEQAIDYCADLGCEGIVIAMMFFQSKEEVLQFADYCNQVALLCEKRNIKLIYHNHFQEFQKFDGQYALDLFLEQTNPDWVKLELDTFWALRGGVDPVAYLNKIGSRCVLIHQKDLAKDCDQVTLLSGKEETIGMEQFGQAKPEQFIEIGNGCMDIAGIIKAAQAIGSVSHIIVEQDYSKLDPIESAAISYVNIQKLMEENIN